jgi:hypothetical protein
VETTHRIDLGEFRDDYANEWVEIRARRGWARAKEIEASAVELRPDPLNPGEAKVTIDLLKHDLLKLEGSIVAWSLDMPATSQGFRSDEFEEALGEWLVNRIDAFYASRRRTDEERKISAGNSTAA